MAEVDKAYEEKMIAGREEEGRVWWIWTSELI